MAKVRYLLLAAFSILAILASAAYWHFFVFSITVLNCAPRPLTKVDLVLGGRELFSGSLASGQARTFHGEPARSGTLDISFDLEGRSHIQKLDYVTPDLADAYGAAFVSMPGGRILGWSPGMVTREKGPNGDTITPYGHYVVREGR